jgi:hypothetical protein
MISIFFVLSVADPNFTKSGPTLIRSTKRSYLYCSPGMNEGSLEGVLCPSKNDMKRIERILYIAIEFE